MRSVLPLWSEWSSMSQRMPKVSAALYFGLFCFFVTRSRDTKSMKFHTLLGKLDLNFEGSFKTCRWTRKHQASASDSCNRKNFCLGNLPSPHHHPKLWVSFRVPRSWLQLTENHGIQKGNGKDRMFEWWSSVITLSSSTVVAKCLDDNLLLQFWRTNPIEFTMLAKGDRERNAKRKGGEKEWHSGQDRVPLDSLALLEPFLLFPPLKESDSLIESSLTNASSLSFLCSIRSSHPLLFPLPLFWEPAAALSSPQYSLHPTPSCNLLLQTPQYQQLTHV